MSHNLKSLKALYGGLYVGECYRDMKGDTRSLDYSSHGSRALGSTGVQGVTSKFLAPNPPPIDLRGSVSFWWQCSDFVARRT